jgi:alpha,alpha-trehalase
LKQEINPRWLEVEGTIYIPKSNSGITLEYTGMNASVTFKQADVILLTFPLDNVFNADESRMDLFYYSLKQADIGPAMSFPIFTVAASRLLDYGCSSQSYLLKSVFPYTRGPFGQFSEQADDNVLTNGGTDPAFPFLTAHGGYLQAIVYGILGLKYSTRLNPDSQKIERFLKFDPVKLHAFPGGVLVRGIIYMGQRLDITLTDDEGIITHYGNAPILVEIQHRNAMSGNYTIKPNTQFIVPAYEPYQNINGSFTECSPISNLTAGAPAEVALSAIDGNNYTYWQPLTREPGRLLIDLKEKKKISSGLVIWGARPAKSLSVYAFMHENEPYEDNYEEILLHFNETKFEKIVDNLPINISEPFDPRYLKEVKLLPNNETIFNIEREDIYTRYVIVEITDAIDQDRPEGGTLNEFALL